MKKASKGMKYIRRGTGECSLGSIENCQDIDIVIPVQVIFKGKVTEIDNYAFRNCTHINSVVIPEGVVSIGEYAFENCKNLEYIELPKSLKTIGRGAFMHCENLKSIELPPAISSISIETFEYCYSLENIDLSHITTIHGFAFADCRSLKDISLSDRIKEIDGTAFLGSGYYTQQKNWKFGLLCLDNWIIGCNGSTKEYTINSNVVGIASDVFANEFHIKRIENPEYGQAMEMLDTALVCFNAPLPDFSKIPPYFEEIVPAKIKYEGTDDDWVNLIKSQGSQPVPAIITTTDGTIKTKL